MYIYIYWICLNIIFIYTQIIYTCSINKYMYILYIYIVYIRSILCKYYIYIYYVYINIYIYITYIIRSPTAQTYFRQSSPTHFFISSWPPGGNPGGHHHHGRPKQYLAPEAAGWQKGPTWYLNPVRCRTHRHCPKMSVDQVTKWKCEETIHTLCTCMLRYAEHPVDGIHGNQKANTEKSNRMDHV